MGDKLRSTALLTGYGFLGGALLSLFVLVPGPVRFVFSLLALWLGIRFFRANDSIARRIGFVVLALVFFCLNVLVVTMILFFRDGMATAP